MQLITGVLSQENNKTNISRNSLFPSPGRFRGRR
jgi:hypothetical protein